MRTNEHGQPVGDPVPWQPRPAIRPVLLTGRTVAVEPLEDRHLDDLAEALLARSPASIWTYLPVGPFTDAAGLAAWVTALRSDPAAVPHALCLPDRGPLGVASYLRLDAANGSAEVGGIVYAAALQRTLAATEAMYLMMRHVFDDLGYRRYEWKCDALNAPSRRAAERLGFSYEGTFRNAQVTHGRNRDTAWFSVIDADWPAIRGRLEAWLAPANFDARGRQRTRLGGTGS